MAWLNATLAFALTMIIFCTMVTAITEAIQRLFRMRRRGLEKMLGELFEKVVWPRVGPSLSAPVKDAIKSNFIATLTSNPAVEEKEGLGFFLRTGFTPRKLDRLNLAQFSERLADTELGKALWSSGRAYATQVVDDVSCRYKSFEDGASLYFGARAQTVSFLVALVLAFALNVDAIRLFSAFISDQQLTARVLEQADAITRHLKTPVAAKGAPPAAAPAAAPAQDEAVADQEPTATPEPGAATPTAVAAAGAPSTTATEADAVGDEDRRAIDERIAFVKEQVNTSTALGLPIGFAYYPWCRGKLAEPNCRRPLESGPAGVRFLGWFASVLLAGLLIGLGGPFWFNAFSTLSTFVQTLGSSKAGKGEGIEAAPPPLAPPQPTTPGEAFAAAAGSTLPKMGRGRMLLTPLGKPQ